MAVFDKNRAGSAFLFVRYREERSPLITGAEINAGGRTLVAWARTTLLFAALVRESESSLWEAMEQRCP